MAEGIRKIALLWKLIKNGTLEKGSILFWDEPEANINPIHIPVITEMLLMLQQDGVQVFVSTHDYFLSKYIEVKKEPKDIVAFYSFYKEKETVLVEKSDKFSCLSNNAILSTFRQLYKDEVEVALR